MDQATPGEQRAATLSQSEVLHLSAMPVRKSSNGGESYNALRGQLVTGEYVAVHESTQPGGVQPNPAHRIDHTEFICVREGTFEFQHDGMTEQASAGDILLVAKGTVHRVRNAGTGPVSYIVVGIGGDLK